MPTQLVTMVVLENVFSITEQVAYACCLLLLCTAPLSPPPPTTQYHVKLDQPCNNTQATQHCKNVVTGKTYNSGALSWLVTYCLLHFRQPSCLIPTAKNVYTFFLIKVPSTCCFIYVCGLCRRNNHLDKRFCQNTSFMYCKLRVRKQFVRLVKLMYQSFQWLFYNAICTIAVRR